MTAADGVQRAGQLPAPEPARALRYALQAGRLRPSTADHPWPGTLEAVAAVLAGAVRRPDPAPPLSSRRQRTARLPRMPRMPRQRPWYARPLPAAMAAGGLVTVTATGLAELAPSAGASGILGVPAQRGPGSTLRGARILPEPAVGPTPDEVPPRTAPPAVAPAPPALLPTGAPSTAPSAAPTTFRPKRTRRPRRNRSTATAGPSTGPTTTPTTTPTGDPTGDPTGQVTIGPPGG